MKGKSPLVMIEQMVMVLVFAIAATLCVKMFVLSGELANKYDHMNRAVLEAQNVAESCKLNGVLQYMEGGRAVYLDSDWNKTTEKDATYYIEVGSIEEDEWIWQANVTVCYADGTEIFSIPVAGQKQTEVADNEKE